MNISDLGGHSGCKIFLCEDDENRLFVRKISGSVNYNQRLKKQAKKQDSFQNECIKTPKILKKGYTSDGMFFFDMEYIHGITLSEYMQTIEVGKVRNVVETIVNNIVDVNLLLPESDEFVFRNKIKELEIKLSPLDNSIVYQALDILKNHSWKNFRRSPCHGDLTLENIIVKNGELYLIDFLDSFYDSWIMDISTLMQDVQTLWSYRFQKEVNINTLIRLIVFRDILMDKVSYISKDFEIDVYFALLLKLIRIYPYTNINDIITYNFLNQKVESIIKIIKEKERL